MTRCLLMCLIAVASPLHAQPAPPQWRLSEALRIGAPDGPGALARIDYVVLSRDGSRVYVLEGISSQIRVFDARTGDETGRFGRTGDGPGEFRGAESLAWRRDTLHVFEPHSGRVHLFTPDGTLVRTERIVPTGLSGGDLHAYPFAVTSDGSVVTRPRLLSREVATGRVTEAPWRLMRFDGTIIRTIDRLNVENTTGAAAVGRGVAYFSQPMSRGKFLVVDPWGESIVVVTQPRGEEESGVFRVERMHPNGSVIYRRAYRYRPVPVPRQFSDSLYAAKAETYSRLVPPGQAEAAARKFLVVPDVSPPVSGVVMAADGSVWLRREDLGTRSVRWLVLDPEGEVQGSVAIPHDQWILQVHGNAVWALATDSFDVPYLVRFQLSRPNGAPSEPREQRSQAAEDRVARPQHRPERSR